jgi:hypothetical protein
MGELSADHRLSNNINGPARRRPANVDKPVESLCALCAHRAFHAQDSARPIPPPACPLPRPWRSFSRSVRVPTETFETPRRALQALRPDGEVGGVTISLWGARAPRTRIEQPEPGADDRKGVYAGRNGPPLHRGRRFRAARCRLQGRHRPAPQDGPQGTVRAPRQTAAKVPSRGLEGGQAADRAKRAGRRQNGTIRGKAGLAKGRAATGRRSASLAGRRAVAAGRQRALPGAAGRTAAGTSDGSCGSGVRPAPEASGGVLPGTRRVLHRTGQPDASIL